MSSLNKIQLNETTYNINDTRIDGIDETMTQDDGNYVPTVMAVKDYVGEQGYTTNTGTVTSVSVKLNGTTKGTVTTSGTIDLGNVPTITNDNLSIPCSTEGSISFDFQDGTSTVLIGNSDAGEIVQLTLPPTSGTLVTQNSIPSKTLYQHNLYIRANNSSSAPNCAVWVTILNNSSSSINSTALFKTALGSSTLQCSGYYLSGSTKINIYSINKYTTVASSVALNGIQLSATYTLVINDEIRTISI